MIVSWNWLKEYVALNLSVEKLTDRLMMAGFNLEGVTEVDGDVAVDLEITSNRPDCLGHLGIAREIAVLLGEKLRLPPTEVAEQGPPIAERVKLEVAPEAAGWCLQYRGRLIEDVRIGPSPGWMQRRLRTIGVKPINNVVDATNYVMFECGQPLHAFDFGKIVGGAILVRNARVKERLEAINHKTYELETSYGVIADATGAAGIAGVMGGAATEVADQTTSVFLEAAEFAPLAIRRTARALDLHSDSSYRFERKIDPRGVAWAADRACRLIVESTGGKAAAGFIHRGKTLADAEAIRLRRGQIPRILGIELPRAEVAGIFGSLGLQIASEEEQSITVVPPSFRRDLTREIDLIEEIGRIHGYDDVPENCSAPLIAAPRGTPERALDMIRGALCGLGYFETVTLTFTDAKSAASIRPWSEGELWSVRHSSRKHENVLRQSLLPSLAEVLRLNAARGRGDAKLYEIARIFLPAESPLPDERPVLGMAILNQGDDKDGVRWRTIRGEMESVFSRLRQHAEVVQKDVPGLAPGSAAELILRGERVGVLGYISPALASEWELRGTVILAEVLLTPLLRAAQLTATAIPLPDQPAIERDLAIVFDESVHWADVEQVARSEAGPELESLEFVDLFRGKQVLAGKKSLAFRLIYRAAKRTLTREEVDGRQQRVIQALGAKFGGVLRQ